jgi:NDP-sugar pyrophosphorylase family protein
MKAMILAAGLGTRLLPLTENRPKPLFPILDRPLLDILIRRLQSAGCEAIIINTHHLSDMIDQFVKDQTCGIPVVTRYEPTILGTAGAIKNVEDFWNDEPFLVINGDIFTNINLEEVYRFHLNHKHPATLVLHDFPQFNHVWVDSGNNIKGFGHTEPCPPSQAVFLAPDTELSSARKSRQAAAADYRKLAFTGIQVLDPHALRFIPKGTFCGIIDTYCEMIKEGFTIKGFTAQNHYWHDIGTMAGYQGATKEALARKAFQTAFPEVRSESVAWSELKGDGSDRTWYRVTQGQDSLIVVDHGRHAEPEVCEADAFAYIGKHLHDKGVPVPRIFAYDRPSGLVALEDLGDLNFQSLLHRSVDTEEVADHYRAVIELLIFMALEGAKGFDLAYTYQTPYYDRELILEKESKYFVEAFLNGYLGLEIDFQAFEDEFDLLAQRALEHPYTGLLHRDFQSRNILIKQGKHYFVDFQGARLGPLQYDLASLLIDPYVALPQTLQDALLQYYTESLSDLIKINKDAFLHAYPYCAVNRNLQILGAFAFLSREKGKKDFEAYIPPAIRSLKQNLERVDPHACRQLKRMVEGL